MASDIAGGLCIVPWIFRGILHEKGDQPRGHWAGSPTQVHGVTKQSHYIDWAAKFTRIRLGNNISVRFPDLLCRNRNNHPLFLLAVIWQKTISRVLKRLTLRTWPTYESWIWVTTPSPRSIPVHSKISTDWRCWNCPRTWLRTFTREHSTHWNHSKACKYEVSEIVPLI